MVRARFNKAQDFVVAAMVTVCILSVTCTAFAQTAAERLSSARQLMKERKLEDAEVAFRAVMRDSAGTPAGVRAELGVADVQRVREEERLQGGAGLSNDLRAKCQELLAKAGDDAEVAAWAKHRLAEILYSRDYFDEALTQHQAIVEQHPGTDAAAASELAIATITDSPWNPKRDRQAALPHYRRALELRPNSETGARAAYKLAEYRYANGNISRGRRDLAAVVARYADSDDPQIQEQVANARLVRAWCDVRQGKFADAAERFREVIDNYRGDNTMNYFTFTTVVANAYIQWAICLKEAGRVYDAMRAFEEVIAKVPGSRVRRWAQQYLADMRMAQLEGSTKLAESRGDKKPTRVAEARSAVGAGKPPVSYECGPLALMTVCTHYGIDATPQKLAQLAGTTTSGTTLYGLTQAAKVKGFRAEALETDLWGLRRLPMPAIALLNNGHFVVVRGVYPGRAIHVIDPSQGDLSMPFNVFHTMWDGYAIALHSPSDPFAELHRPLGRALTRAEAKHLLGAFLCCNNYEVIADPCEEDDDDDPCCGQGEGEDVRHVHVNPVFKAGPQSGGSGGGCGGGQTCFKGRLLFALARGHYYYISPVEPSIVGGKGPSIRVFRTHVSNAPRTIFDFGYGWRWNYGTQLKLAQNGNDVMHLRTDGATRTYTALADGTYEKPDDISRRLRKRTDGTHITHPLGGGIFRRYDAMANPGDYGELLDIYDRDGNKVVLTYDGNGKLEKITDASGRALTITRSDGIITKITDHVGKEWRYEYDNSHLVKVINPAGYETHYEYNTGGTDHYSIKKITDPRGRATQISCDSREGATLEWVQYPDATKTNIDTGETTDEEGMPYRNIRNAEGFPTTYDSLTDAQDPHTRLVKDALGNATHYDRPDEEEGNPYLVRAVTDPMGSKTTYTRDCKERITQVSNALGQTTRYSYDANDKLVEIRDPADNETKYEYDLRGRLIKVIDPLDKETTYTYNAAGLRKTMTGPNNHTWTYGYDGVGRLISVKDPLNNETKYTYDAMDRRTSVTDPEGNTTYYTYDVLGRVTQITYPDNNTVQNEYDCCNLVKKTDEEGNSTEYSYDIMDRLINVKDPLNNETKYEYDVMGRRTKVTDARDNSTTYSYDNAGRLTKITYPDSTTETYAYDKAGRRTSKTDGRGLTTYYKYDELGRLIEIKAQTVPS